MTEQLSVQDFVLASLVYLFWQTCYFVKTEVIDKAKLDASPEKLTSLRWLSKDTKNPLARAILKTLKSLGIFQRDEDYDASTTKTKLVFIGSQFIYTLFTFAPTYLFYSSSYWHLGYIVFVFTVSVFYGASFYIEIFSSRYLRQLEGKRGGVRKIASSQKVAQIAVETAATAPLLEADLQAAEHAEQSGTTLSDVSKHIDEVVDENDGLFFEENTLLDLGIDT